MQLCGFVFSFAVVFAIIVTSSGQKGHGEDSEDICRSVYGKKLPVAKVLVIYTGERLRM
jgi:hypothetical protein